MPDWINNTHAGFVLAAYAVAAFALAGIGVASLRDYRRRAKEWDAMSHKSGNDD